MHTSLHQAASLSIPTAIRSTYPCHLSSLPPNNFFTCNSGRVTISRICYPFWLISETSSSYRPEDQLPKFNTHSPYKQILGGCLYLLSLLYIFLWPVSLSEDSEKWNRIIKWGAAFDFLSYWRMNWNAAKWYEESLAWSTLLIDVQCLFWECSINYLPSNLVAWTLAITWLY